MDERRRHPRAEIDEAAFISVDGSMRQAVPPLMPDQVMSPRAVDPHQLPMIRLMQAFLWVY
jgi:hypothetical protein